MMTKAHFHGIASVLADPDLRALCLDDPDDRIELVRKFADMLQRQNPAFNRDRFFAAALKED